MKRIHIVGVSPRTGTTLMAEALKTCFAVDAYAAHEDRLFIRAAGHPDIFLSKYPRDIMFVGPSLRVDPDLYVICMIRDPRDIVCSIHNKAPDRYWASLKFWNLYTTRLRTLLPHPRFIPVYYEVFVSRPDHVQNRVARCLPFLTQKAPFSQYHTEASVSNASKKALRNIRPISPASVGKWRRHKPRVAGQVKLHGPITDDLITFGYETNADWLAELKGVTPDLTPSFHSEFMTFKKRRTLTFGKYLEAERRIIEQQIGRRIRITYPNKWFRGS